MARNGNSIAETLSQDRATSGRGGAWADVLPWIEAPAGAIVLFMLLVSERTAEQSGSSAVHGSTSAAPGRPTLIALKVAMAITGVVLFGFSIVHALGTLQIFSGPEQLNFYAALLRKVPALLWAIRGVLLVSFVVHVWTAIYLKLHARQARPISYERGPARRVTSLAARSMLWTGLLLAAFLVYHLLHFTFGRGPWYDHQNVYNTMVYGFQIGWLTALYIVGSVLFGLHLYHGAWSWLDTLGLSHPRYNRFRKPLARGLAIAVTAAYVVQPVAVYVGAVEPTERTFCYPELAKHPGECEPPP